MHDNMESICVLSNQINVHALIGQSAMVYCASKAIPVKCFISHRPPSREGGSVGWAKKKKNRNEHMNDSECQWRPGC